MKVGTVSKCLINPGDLSLINTMKFGGTAPLFGSQPSRGLDVSSFYPVDMSVDHNRGQRKGAASKTFSILFDILGERQSVAQKGVRAIDPRNS